MIILPRLLGVQWVYFGAFFIDFITIIWTLFLVKKEFIILKSLNIENENNLVEE